MRLCLSLVFSDGAKAAIRFNFGVGTVKLLTDLAWMCLGDWLVREE